MMKSNPIKLILLIFFIVCRLGHAQGNKTWDSYSSHKIGDTISLTSGEKEDVAHIIIFTAPASCWTCELSLESFVRLKKNHHVAITMFLEGVSQEYADSEKSRNGWPFEVLGDPLHVYQKSYAVEFTPFYYLTNGGGQILALDKLAGSISPDSLRSLVEQMNHPLTINSSSDLTPLRDIVVHDSLGSSVIIGKKHYLLSFHYGSKIAILDASLKMFYIVDSIGSVVHAFDLAYRGLLTPVGLFWIKYDSLIAFRDMDVHTLSCRLYTLNVISDEFSQKDYDITAIPKNCHILNIASNLVDHRLYGGISPVYALQKFDPQQPAIASFDMSGDLKRLFGKPDSVLTVEPAFIESAFFAFDDEGHIYELEQPSDSVNIYNDDGSLLKHLCIHYGTAWRKFTMDIPTNIDSKFWIDMNEKTSYVTGIFVSRDQIAVSYYNTMYKPGEEDPKAAGMILNYYIHRESSEGLALDKDDISLPVNVKPFAVDDRHIFASIYEDNHLRIMEYKMPTAKF
jgi:hypothetical protein